MTLQPMPDMSRIPDLESIDLSDIAIPAEIQSVLTGFLTGGLMGGLDSLVFNGIPMLPDGLRGMAGSLYGQITSGQFDLTETVKGVLDVFVNDGTTEAITSMVGSVVGGNPLDLLSGTSPTTQLLQQFGNIAGFALPGTNVVQTASTILSSVGLGVDIPFLSSGGLGIGGAATVLGGPGAVVASLVAPSVFKIFGGLFGGGSDPRKQCPCLEICRKTDHFITEGGVVLLKTCAPVMMSSISSEGGGDMLSGIF